MKKLITFLFIFTVLGSNFFGGMVSEASNAPTFSVTPIIPENQIGDTKSYFDLRVSPNQVQTIEVELSNSGKESIKVAMEMVTAQSNQNGIVDYTQPSNQLDKSVFFSFAEQSELDSVISLEAGEKKRATITLKSPGKSFEGVLLGGINFSEKVDDEESETKQIGNRFAYTVAVMLSQKDGNVSPDLKLLDVQAGQANYRNMIIARIQNPKTTLISDMVVKADVYTEKGTDPLFSRKASNLKMAPTSSLPFHIETSSKPLKAGTYRLEMSATIDGKEWTWNELFTIDAKQAKELNESAIGIEEDNTLLYVGIIVAGLLCIGGLTYFLVYRHKKKKRLEEEKRRKRRRKRRKMVSSSAHSYK